MKRLLLYRGLSPNYICRFKILHRKVDFAWASKFYNKHKKAYMSDKNVVNVWFPKESYCTVESHTKEGHPVITVIQESLKKFEFKNIFAWNLSIIFDLNDVGDNGMPSGDEIGIIQDYCDNLEKLFNDNPEKPNALFLFRETYDGTCEVVWRVYDADKVDTILKKVIEEKKHPREFDYEMEYDEEWKLVEWYLQDFTRDENN